MDPSTPDDTASTASSRAFPGGRVRLPRLDAQQRNQQTEINVVSTAFFRGPTTVIEEEPPVRSGFSEYFSYESLFDGGDAATVEEELDATAYRVLNVSPTDDWPTIVASHRSLVKQFHPDRFANHPPAVIAEAEAEIKRINIAYSELRSTHPGANSSERSAPSNDQGDRRRGDRRAQNSDD